MRDVYYLKVQLDEGAYAPIREHGGDAGLDLKTPCGFTLEAGKSHAVDTGVHVEIPRGYAGFIKAKSGLNVKHGITCTGVIDSGYSGSIVVNLQNLGGKARKFKRGDKVAQLVIVPIELPSVNVVREIKGGERGDAGFGSTGR